MTEPSASCPFCEKTGLPILPLRAAVARTDFEDVRASWKGLDLPANMCPDATGIPLPAQSAKYTGRLLRPGYLYVFNEVRGEWKAYLVTPLGYLYEFDIDTTTPPDADKIEFTCFRTGEESIARCITIPDAENAGNVWLAFSDTAWTTSVLARHQKQAYREKHMRVVDVKQWVGGSTSQPHTAPFSHLANVVNEFARSGIDRGAEKKPVYNFLFDSYPSGPQKTPESGKIEATFNLDRVTISVFPPFDFSPHKFEGCKHETSNLMEWALAITEPHEPMLVAVDDPIGITMEIAALMGTRLDAFLSQKDLERPLAISTLVDSIGEAIRNQAELDGIRTAQKKAVADLYYWRKLPAMSMDGIRDPVRERMESEHWEKLNQATYRKEWEDKVAAAEQTAADSLSNKDLDRLATKAWDKYDAQLQAGEPEGWRARIFIPRMEKFDRDAMVPLAKAHRAWLKSSTTFNSFECNHDNDDADSGAGFVQALLLCIRDTQQNQICFDTYQDWLSANTADPKNLLQRALMHNQKALLDELNEAIPARGLPSSKLPEVPWDSLITLYRESLKHIDAGGTNIVAQLVTAVGGPVIKVLDNAFDRSVGRLVIALGMLGDAPISIVTHTGTVSGALDVVASMMKELNPKALASIDPDLFKRQLEIQSRGRRQTIQKRGRFGRFGKSEVTLRVDRYALGRIGGNGSPAQIASRAARTVLTMDEWPKNNMARFQTAFGADSRIAVVGLILQVVGAKSMAEKLDNSMTHQRQDNSWRFRSASTSIVAGVGELLHDGFTKGAEAGGLRLAKAASSVWLKTFGLAARVIGFVGAGIMAVCDGVKAWDEMRKGNYGIGSLYVLSAAAGVGAALLFSGVLGAVVAGVSATGLGLALVLFGIAIAIAIDFFRTDELQDWLERCMFGALDKREHYTTLQDEMNEFGLAMKAMGFEGTDESSNATKAH